jgi:Mn2+/Fe2+ NRAMP family transporter
METTERPALSRWDRRLLALAAAAGAVIVLAVGMTAVLVPGRCGLEFSFWAAIFVICFWFPVTLVLAAFGAVMGYANGKKTLLVEAGLLALALLTIGVQQVIPHDDKPSGAIGCRFDL